MRVPAEHTLNAVRPALEMQFLYENNVSLSIFYDVVDDSENEEEIKDDQLIFAIT